MSKHSILIIDDEEVITESMSHILEQAQYKVYTAPNGQTGIEAFKNERPQLVITDLMMSGIDGIDVLKEIKSDSPEALVIILTGHGELESAIEAVHYGASEYLLKPCNKTEILHRVKECFEKREMQIQIKAYEKIIPVCCQCRKIRDDRGRPHESGEWVFADEFIERHSDLDASHTYCNDCAEKIINS
ncbi:MAG: response regulator [Candidatus Nitrohelix vancouverensis]|uniref:Response regulator n=1 Tax=Candidatus Nitrohelix vancouverensis TaxID=2705534 RepID=A0A7T0G4S0_9BACT|nr:MAG: response regulator [Candidatus Nitrohelix vancouverensis]